MQKGKTTLIFETKSGMLAMAGGMILKREAATRP